MIQLSMIMCPDQHFKHSNARLIRTLAYILALYISQNLDYMPVTQFPLKKKLEIPELATLSRLLMEYPHFSDRNLVSGPANQTHRAHADTRTQARV